MQSLLTLSDKQICIAPDGSVPVMMSISPTQIVEAAFGQALPRASQLEAAINLVEDSIMATGLRSMPRGRLVTDAPLLHQALQLTQLPTTLSLAQVEQRYQDIAQTAQRLPTTPISKPVPQALASLIFVRECMHHLGYTELALV
jgi:hypothetical protein